MKKDNEKISLWQWVFVVGLLIAMLVLNLLIQLETKKENVSPMLYQQLSVYEQVKHAMSSNVQYGFD